MVVLPLSPLSSYIAVESMNMMNSGKVWDKMVWPSSHLQQLSKFCEKWSRQLESWDELFKWVSDNIGFLLNRNLRYRTNIQSFSCQLNDFTTYVIAFQYSSALRNPLRYSRFNFLIFFFNFQPLSFHFWSDLSLTYCSYSSSLWTFFIFKLSNKDPYGWVLRSDESIPFTVKSWKYTKDKQFKESSVVGMCFVTATSCTISMKKVNVITMESDFMRNRCCGCRTISDGLKETMYKTITEYHFACVLYAYFRK
jgi:hypothetical protein